MLLLLLIFLPAMIPTMLRAMIKSMRPKQWVKNGFIFAGLAFDQQLFDFLPFLYTTIGFILLCLGASAVYLINDVADLERDRLHPVKKHRPIPSGELSRRTAITAAALLFLLSLAIGFFLNRSFGFLLFSYLVLNLFYSFRLKHVPILDVLIIAAGFVLRVGSGVALITVERFSPWLYMCTTLLALFIGFGKRRAEIVLLAERANSHRRVLDGYTVPFLDQLIVIVSSATIMAYSLYTFFAENLPGNNMMMLTIPFVIYGIFRYLHLVNVEGAGGAPEELVLADRPLMATVILWAASAVGILYLGT